ncbi:branched chain amino acid ABC transporter substrate-binding protein [Geothermobacter hydrogeniphilus]|uniref:Branched chain amino acid ABC transporter substrate-binding protein n=1 Tax=Geothermobacter hydrogeniphilus TaxID=1969733 RepID=A0A2K2H8X3_9BACT|nr:branched-chain amino acid ABC transporter substrate-binding protein [Geothermobacter hydrogeniphilus]PNU19679.1 branched chain amino acid ABC transporter substrate-binding protein [Geothermobacter hydrogeniphilus]
MRTLKVLATAALVAALAVPVFAADTIKIGVAGPHTGDLAPYGIPTKEAALMVAEQVNAAGGILGKKVEVLPMDDQCKPEIATNAATKLVSEGVTMVIGHVCSGATKAAMGIYKEAGVIAISPSATNPPLTQSGDYPNFFRTIASDDMQGKLAADFVTGKLGAKKIAIIHDKGDYGKGFADFAKKFIEEGGKAKVVMYEGITPGAMDYSAVIQKVRREGADAVIFGGYHPEASKLVSQLKKKHVKAAFLGPDGIKGDGFLEIAGKKAEGVYATGPMDVTKYADNQKARAAYQQKYGKEPGTFFDQGYAAMEAALNAIKVAGGTDYAKVEKALRSSYVDTTVGKIKFDNKGDAVGVGFSVYQVQNGKFVEQ